MPTNQDVKRDDQGQFGDRKSQQPQKSQQGVSQDPSKKSSDSERR